MKLAPIILFVYNRPWHTEQTINALKENELADQSDLIIYSDAPKTDKNTKSVNSVRQYLKEIKGFKTVTIIERENNWGLAANIIDGVTEVVNKFGRIIVLEDDLVTSPAFLSFMNQALEHFKTNEKVMQISGYALDTDFDVETDAIFLPFISSWGWGTWKRSWKNFDPLMPEYEELKQNWALRLKFDVEGAYNYFHMLEEQIKGKIDSWAIRWYLSVFMLKGIVLYPVTSLVRNIGFDGSGTHCGRSSLSQPTAFNKSSFGHRYNLPEPLIKEGTYNNVVNFLFSKQTIEGKLRYIFLKFNQIIKS